MSKRPTNEIAELLNDWSIAKIDPRNTIIRQVKIDNADHIIDIYFDEIEEDTEIWT